MYQKELITIMQLKRRPPLIITYQKIKFQHQKTNRVDN